MRGRSSGGERLLGMEKVAGSIPAGSTKMDCGWRRQFCLRHLCIRSLNMLERFCILGKEYRRVKRILLLLAVLGAGAYSPKAALGQAKAVGVVVSMREGCVASLDVSYPGTTSLSLIQTDMQELAYKTGWRIVGEPVESKGQMLSVHAEVQSGAVQSLLDDVVWPIVAALSRHQRLGIVVLGGPLAVGALVIENRFVRLEQRGGQNVHSYIVDIKDNSFRTIEELKQPGPPKGRAESKRKAWLWAWTLVLGLSVAAGSTAYWLVQRAYARPKA